MNTLSQYSSINLKKGAKFDFGIWSVRRRDAFTRSTHFTKPLFRLFRSLLPLYTPLRALQYPDNSERSSAIHHQTKRNVKINNSWLRRRS